MRNIFRDGQLLKAVNLNDAFTEVEQKANAATTKITHFAKSAYTPSELTNHSHTKLYLSAVSVQGNALATDQYRLRATRSGVLSISVNYACKSARAYIQASINGKYSFRQEINDSNGSDQATLSFHTYLNTGEWIELYAYKAAGGKPEIQITGYFIEEGKTS
ncbi:hypothetical protein [Arcanobacterium haemolyticum]